MIVISETCEKSNYVCNAIHFQRNFDNWTSGNNDIDKFIQEAQLLAHDSYRVLEWVSYDRFYNIKYIAKGGFGKVYRANWIDGFMVCWDDENKNWKRFNQNMFVVLKILNNPKNDSISEFINNEV